MHIASSTSRTYYMIRVTHCPNALPGVVMFVVRMLLFLYIYGALNSWVFKYSCAACAFVWTAKLSSKVPPWFMNFHINIYGFKCPECPDNDLATTLIVVLILTGHFSTNSRLSPCQRLLYTKNQTIQALHLHVHVGCIIGMSTSRTHSSNTQQNIYSFIYERTLAAANSSDDIIWNIVLRVPQFLLLLLITLKSYTHIRYPTTAAPI